ncbi:OmpA family protein, partial [Halorubrum tibetense]
EIAKHLAIANNPIQVEGYTDSEPIQTSLFPSNWELSAARASAVVKLLAASGVTPERLSAVGYGEFQPIADNTTEAGRAQNRRVVLMVAREKPNRPTRSVDNQDVSGILEADTFVDVPESLQQPSGEPADPLIEFGEAPVLVPTLTQEGDSESSDAPGQPKINGLRAIKLESGGLLFTSDPARG